MTSNPLHLHVVTHRRSPNIQGGLGSEHTPRRGKAPPASPGPPCSLPPRTPAKRPASAACRAARAPCAGSGSSAGRQPPKPSSAASRRGSSSLRRRRVGQANGAEDDLRVLAEREANESRARGGSPASQGGVPAATRGRGGRCSEYRPGCPPLVPVSRWIGLVWPRSIVDSVVSRLRPCHAGAPGRELDSSPAPWRRGRPEAEARRVSGTAGALCGLVGRGRGERHRRFLGGQPSHALVWASVRRP